MQAEEEEGEAPGQGAAQLERPAKSGYLWKQSQWKKKFNKRWFVLWPNAPVPNKGRILFYYDTPQDKRPRGVIELTPGAFTLMTSAGRSVKDRDFPLCLVIKLQNKRRESFLLATDNEPEVMAWAHAINSIQVLDGGGPPNPGAELIFSSTQLRDQLARESDDEDGDSPGSGRAAGAAAAGGGGGGGAAALDDESDVTGILIELDAVTSERDNMCKHQAVLQNALQLFLPTADVSRSDKLLEQANHAASGRAESQQLQADLSQAQRRAADIARAREAEQALQQRGEQQLHQELSELRTVNSTLRGDEQLAREEVEALKVEVVRLRQDGAAADGGSGGGSDPDGGGGGGGDGEEEGSSPSGGSGGADAATAAAVVAAALVRQEALVSDLQQQLLDDKSESDRSLLLAKEEIEEYKVKHQQLEEIMKKVTKKNRDLSSQKESTDSSAASHGERMKELTDENRALMTERNDSNVNATTARQQLDKCLQALDEADRQISALQAEKGSSSDQLNIAQQQIMQLRADNETVSAELEAAYENAGELNTRMDEATAEIGALKVAGAGAADGGNGGGGAAEKERIASLEGALAVADAGRQQAEAAKLDLETKVIFPGRDSINVWC